MAAPEEVPRDESAAEPQSPYLGETWTWATILTLAEFAPAVAAGFSFLTQRGGSPLVNGLTTLMGWLAGVAVFMRTNELDDGGTLAKREGYRNWRRVRAVGVAVTFAIAFSPLGEWLASPWQSQSMLVGVAWGVGLAVVAGVGWLFHAGDQVLSAYGTPAGGLVDLLVGPVWLVRALTAHGLMPLLLGIGTSSRELIVAGFFMTVTEYLLARRTTTIVARTSFWDLLRGQQRY